MKFLALKQALDQALNQNLAVDSKYESNPKTFTGPPKHKKQTVVGGELLLKPVNRTAARILWKAPWWAFLLPQLNSNYGKKNQGDNGEGREPWRRKAISSPKECPTVRTYKTGGTGQKKKKMEAQKENRENFTNHQPSESAIEETIKMKLKLLMEGKLKAADLKRSKAHGER